MIRIAHLTDLHFYAGLPHLSSLIGKRAIGAFNLHCLGRRHQFDGRVARQAIEMVAAARPDCALITGDLTSMATMDEMEMARDALQSLSAIPTMVIAGNHDIYCRGSRRFFNEKFSPWMGSVDPQSGLQSMSIQQDRIHLVGIDACRPTMVGSSGEIPRSQITALSTTLQKHNNVVLLIHYPIVDHDGTPYHERHRWHGIANGSEMLDALRVAPRKPLMIVHGHAHRGFSTSFNGIPIFNAGSSGHAFIDKPAQDRRHAAFNIYEIDTTSRSIVVRRFVHNGTTFIEQANAYSSSST